MAYLKDGAHSLTPDKPNDCHAKTEAAKNSFNILPYGFYIVALRTQLHQRHDTYGGKIHKPAYRLRIQAAVRL